MSKAIFNEIVIERESTCYFMRMHNPYQCYRFDIERINLITALPLIEKLNNTCDYFRDNFINHASCSPIVFNQLSHMSC